MTASPRCAVVIAALLLAAGCGGADSATTTTAADTVTTTTASTTTDTVTTTTSSTLPPDTGPLAGLLVEQVADPLLGTASHDMEYGDATRTFVISQAALTAAGGKLILAPFDPAPTTTGLAADQILLEAWIAPHAGVAPRAIVLYGLGVGGWNPYVVIDSASILAYLSTSTDYLARRPQGPVDVRTTPTSFDWTGSAHFIADVAVFAADPAGDSPAYEGQIECTYVGSLECETLSDDGILRPGDEGEPVAALQEALADLGFYTGAGEGLFDEATEEAVRLFQRDYRLAVDGKAGPRTLDLIDDVVSGASNIVMASQEGVGEVAFGTPADTARPALNAIFGSPDASTGWFSSPCSGADWLEITWDGFTAIFTDRNGSRQFDGWEVNDLQDLPSWLYFAGGIRPSWRWSDFESMGADSDFDPESVAFWYHHDLGYNNGRFVNPPSGSPAANARISGFGTGTGAFVSC